MMEKTLYPNHPVRCIIPRPSECGESVFLTSLILNFINEFDKKIYLLTKSSSRFLSKSYLNVLVILYIFK